MNKFIIIGIITIIIIVIISIIAFMIYKMKYQTYSTLITINLKVKEPAQEATLTKTITSTNPEIEEINYIIQNLDDSILTELNITNPEQRTLNINIEFKDNLDCYIIVNSLIDALKKVNIANMDYKGNMYEEQIKKDGKFTEENGKIKSDNMALGILYVSEFTDYKDRDIAEENKYYVEKVEQQTQEMKDEANKPIEEQAQAPEQEQEQEQKEEQTQDQEQTQTTESFTEALQQLADKEPKKYEFVKTSLTSPLFIKIIFKNETTKTEKTIKYPIYSYTGFKIMEEVINVLLESYKGLISKSDYAKYGEFYELHYQSDKTLENDYKKMYKELCKKSCCLILHLNGSSYVYQSYDVPRFKRYMKKLEEMDIDTDDIDEYEDFNVEEAEINNIIVIDEINK